MALVAALCSSLPISRVCGAPSDIRASARQGVILECSSTAPSELAKAPAKSPGNKAILRFSPRISIDRALNLSAAGWKAFSKNVSGEWSGAAVDFDYEGKPLRLPSSLVPREYVEWDVEVCDWETYCATLANEKSPKFYNKAVRLYPTVGCGATTVSIYSTEEQTLEEATDEMNEDLLAFHPSGAYIAVWESKKRKVVEHCLVDKDEEGSRIRFLQKIKACGTGVEEITIFKEQWEDMFQSGKTVESCLTRHVGFAEGPRLRPSDLRGVWQIVKSSFSPAEGCARINKLIPETTSPVERTDAKGKILLPQGTWSATSSFQEKLSVEVGWVTRPGILVLSRCILTHTGKIQKLEVETQYRDTKLREYYRTSYENYEDTLPSD